jgi:hypothetical protein
MTPNAQALTAADLARWQRPALVAGAAGLALFAGGALLGDGAAAWRAYLVAWNFWLGIALGCLAVLMLQYLTGGAWGLVLRRVLEAASRTLPLLAAAFLPVAIFLPQLYGWVNSHDPHLAEKQTYYLNLPFFLIRAAAYFGVWILLATLLSFWSRRQDEEPNSPAALQRLRGLSGPGLVLYGLTITFASIDWVMSLEPRWSSTIYGVMFAMGQVLSGFSFGVVVLILLAGRPPLSSVLEPGHLRDLGGLLLAFVMVWAYMGFSQLLLVWSGNLSEEIPWYMRRLRGGWQWLGLALVLFQFALPFLLLLSGDVKTGGRPLLAVAGMVLVMRLADLFWLIVPAQDDAAAAHLAPHWPELLLCVAAFVGLGGLWLTVFLWQLGRRPLLPLHEPVPGERPEHA